MAVVANALTTVSRQIDYMGISSLTATQTTVMEAIINATTAFVESYTGRRFIKTTYTNEEYDGQADERIILNDHPIIEGETFTFQRRDSGENQDDWTTIDASNYFVKEDLGEIYLAGRANFFLAIDKYRVTYTAGFDYDNVTTFLADTGAGDLEMAVWMMVAETWLKRGSSPNIKGERLKNYAVTYGSPGEGSFFKNSDGGISLVQVTLDKYKSLEFEGALTPKQSQPTDDDLWG